MVLAIRFWFKVDYCLFMSSDNLVCYSGDGVKCAQLFLILLLRMYREHEDTAQAEVKHPGDTD
jgi:hypothetical protein